MWPRRTETSVCLRLGQVTHRPYKWYRTPAAPVSKSPGWTGSIECWTLSSSGCYPVWLGRVELHWAALPVTDPPLPLFRSSLLASVPRGSSTTLIGNFLFPRLQNYTPSLTSVTLLHRTTLKTKRESCDLSRCLSSHPKHFPMHTPLLLLRSSAPRRSSACIGWDLFLKRSFLNTYAPFVTDREEFCHVSVGHTDIPLSQTPFTAIKMQTRRFLIALIKYAFSPGTLFPYTEITTFHPPNNKQVCCAAWSWLTIV